MSPGVGPTRPLVVVAAVLAGFLVVVGLCLEIRLAGSLKPEAAAHSSRVSPWFPSQSKRSWVEAGLPVILGSQKLTSMQQ